MSKGLLKSYEVHYTDNHGELKVESRRVHAYSLSGAKRVFYKLTRNYSLIIVDIISPGMREVA